MDEIMRDSAADAGDQPGAARQRALLDADHRRTESIDDAGSDGQPMPSPSLGRRELEALLRSRGIADMSALDPRAGEDNEPQAAAPEQDLQAATRAGSLDESAAIAKELAPAAWTPIELVPPVLSEAAPMAACLPPEVEDPIQGERAPDSEPVVEMVSAADAAAALDAAEDTLEIDESMVGDGEDGLPPVPELADADAVSRVVFVLLLSQREGLSLFRLAQACNTTQKLVEQSLPSLQQWLDQLALPVEIVRTGDSLKFLSRPDAFPFLQRLRGVKKMEKLSPAALETLAVIAYRQPVMRAEIEAIRGVKAGPMLRTLLQHKLVRVTGRADVPGRPLQYGTTDQFLERFGLASLQELPSIKEWKQLG
jgi:segregation and condensation protein B